MEKVWIITIDEVDDFVHYHHSPLVFANEARARERLNAIKEDNKKGATEEGWVIEESQDCIDIYEDGCYAQYHYSAVLEEVDIW